MLLKRSELKWLEKIVKGAANHRRIQILEKLAQSPGLSLLEVSLILKINMKTAGEHTRRLWIAGLVEKRSDGKSVRHKLTIRGNNVLKFLRTLE